MVTLGDDRMWWEREAKAGTVDAFDQIMFSTFRNMFDNFTC